MHIPRVKRVAHVVLYVRDPEASAKWYGEVLGMKVSARVPDGPYKGGVFMSFGEYDHDIALFPDFGTVPKGKEFEHIGLQVDCDNDIDSLRRLYGWMIQKKVKLNEVLDHGVSTGVISSIRMGISSRCFASGCRSPGGRRSRSCGAMRGRR